MRRNLTIFVLAVVVVFLAAFFLVFRPQIAKINAAKADVEAARTRVTTLTAEVQRLRALQQRAPQLREEATVLDTAMPNDPQLADFILRVQESANASGIEWMSVSPTPPAAGGVAGTLEVSIAMAVTGGYFQVQDFLIRLEQLPRAIKIGGVTLGVATPAPGGGSPELAASLTMKMFVATTTTAPAPPAGA